jgi:hypothetical protein
MPQPDAIAATPATTVITSPRPDFLFFCPKAAPPYGLSIGISSIAIWRSLSLYVTVV